MSLGLGYDLCFFVQEDTSLAGALIEVLDVSLIITYHIFGNKDVLGTLQHMTNVVRVKLALLIE